MQVPAAPRPVLVILEGIHDLEVFLRMSQRLASLRPDIPDLAAWLAQGRILLVPTGGGHGGDWARRFQGLGCREFHLLDRETGAETERRQQAVRLVNDRPDCQGFLTSKRALENYLHAQAISQAGGGEITVTDDACVGTELARHRYELTPQPRPWSELLRRSKRRLIYRTKRWLNHAAIDEMTPELLAQRDPAGEVLSWLSVISQLVTEAATSSCS
jgi:hypothetical protein